MNYYVYMLWSIKSKKIKTYVGYTINLKCRLKKHNLGNGAKSTRGRFWKVIYKRVYKTKSEALKAEYYLKNNSVLREKIKNSYVH